MKRMTWLIAGLGLAAAAIIIIMASPRASAWQIGDVYTGGDWTINNPTEIGAETVTVAGNLTINSKLTMYNARINIDSGTTDGLCTVNVASGATYNIWAASTLTAANGNYHYKFTVYGTLDVNGSTVSEMWGDTTWWTGGIQLYSSGSTIRNNSNVTLGKTGGILIVNCTATITGSNIYSNGAGGASTTYCYGILASSDGTTSTKIDNCKVYTNTYSSGSNYYGYGIISNFQTAADTITNCFIYNNGGTTLVNNYGYQLYLQYSRVTITNDYLGNGTYGLYAVESAPPTITNVNINSYTYNSPTYGVWAYNSSLSFQSCNFATTYVSSTQYGVYASGPSSNSASKLSFLSCTFTYTLASTAPRYNIYTAGGYTPISITTCTFQDTSGSSVYCVYSGSFSPVDIVTSTMTVSTTTAASGAVYGSVYCPINITWSTITLTNIAQAMANLPAYMIYGFNNSPVKVANCVLTMSLNPGTSIVANPRFYMIYTDTSSPITVSASTMNMVMTAVSGNPQYASYYLIYTTTYSGAAVSNSWLNFTSNPLSNFATIYTIYAQASSPVKVASSSLLTTITYAGTSTNAYFNQIYGNDNCPIAVSGGSNLQITATSSAPSTIVRTLNAFNSTVSVDYSTLSIGGTYSAANDYFYLVTLSTNSAFFLNYSTTKLSTTNTGTGAYFYTVNAANSCPMYIFKTFLGMTETVSQTGSYHYFIWGNSYCPVFIDSSVISFAPTVSVTTGTQYFYVFNLQSYSHLGIDSSTIDVLPYTTSTGAANIYIAYPMSYSRAWLNYSFINIAPPYLSNTTYVYGIGAAGSANYASIDLEATNVNVTMTTAGNSPYLFYCNYFFSVSSSAGQGSYLAWNDSKFTMMGTSVLSYGVYLQYFFHSAGYSPAYIHNGFFNLNVTSTSLMQPLFFANLFFVDTYSPLMADHVDINLYLVTNYYINWQFIFHVRYSYLISIVDNVNINIFLLSTGTTTNSYILAQFWFHANYTYSITIFSNITINAYEVAYYYVVNMYPLYTYYTYGQTFFSRMNWNLYLNSTTAWASSLYFGMIYYYNTIDMNNCTWRMNIWAGTFSLCYGYYGALYNQANFTDSQFFINVTAVQYITSNYIVGYWQASTTNPVGAGIIQWRNSAFICTFVSLTQYIILNYPIYLVTSVYQYNWNCTFAFNFTTLSTDANSYVAATSYGFINEQQTSYFYFTNGTFNVTVNTNYPQWRMSPYTNPGVISFQNSIINVKFNQYTLTSGGYFFSFWCYNGGLEFNNTVYNFSDSRVQFYYGIQGSTSNTNIIMKNFTYIANNNLISNIATHIYASQCPKLDITNSRFYVINETGGSPYVTNKTSFVINAYDCPVNFSNSIMSLDMRSVNLDNVNGFYGICVDGNPTGSTVRPFTIANSSFYLKGAQGTNGGWLITTRNGFVNTGISNCTFNITPSSWNAVVFRGQSTSRNFFAIDNCTIDYITPVSQGGMGGCVWAMMNYTDLYVNNTVVNMRNDAGMFPFEMFSGLNYAKCFFNNDILNYTLGGGTGTALVEAQMGYNLASVATMNFTNTPIRITVRDEPVNLKTFNFDSGKSGSVSLVNSPITWTINAPGSSAGFLTFNANPFDPPTVQTLVCQNSKLSMIMARENSAASLFSMRPGAGLQSVAVTGTPIDITIAMSSSIPTYAISMDGQKEITLQDLSFKINAPADTTTVLVGIQMIKSSTITFDNFTITGNSQGRITGILCDMVSLPVIKNSLIQNGYIGIQSNIYSNPTIINTTITNCKFGLVVDTYGNATAEAATITNVDTAVTITNSSWASLIDCILTSRNSNIDMNQGSTAWLLSTAYTSKPVNFYDDKSTLIVNWWLGLRVIWQNEVPIPGAEVVMDNVNHDEYMRVTTNGQGQIPRFSVVEFIQTGQGGANKISFSPYSVDASFGGLTGSIPSLVTSSSQEVNVTIRDDGLPVLTLLEPEENIIQNFTKVSLSGLASDFGSGISRLNFSYMIGGEEHWLQSFPASSAWVTNFNVPEGANITIKVRLSDVTGNEVFETRNITIDLTPPNIDVTSPAYNSLGNVISVELKGSVEKGSSLTINYRPVAVDASGAFSYTVRLIEGSNTFYLNARDRAGNTNSTSWVLRLDVTPPFLVITYPKEGMLTNRSTITVTGQTEPGVKSLTINGAPVEVQWNGSFSVNVALVRGTNTITAEVLGNAGNRMKVVRTVFMDNEIHLSIQNPPENLVTSQVTLVIRGSTDTDCLLRLNDNILSVAQDGNFTLNYILTEGLNTLAFSVADGAGNTLRVVRRVTLDTVNPWIDVTSPDAGKTYKTNSITVKGTCEAGISLTINGQNVTTDTGSFSLQLSLLPEGTNAVTVVGADIAGNTVTMQLSVQIDTAAPSLEIVEPLEGFRTQEKTVVVVGITEPGATVTVNGVRVTVDAFGKFSTSVTVEQGKNTITVKASDAAGNSAPDKTLQVKVMAPTGAGAGDQSWLWAAIGLGLAVAIIFPLTILFIRISYPLKKRPGE
jgi:hypothetical protein